MTRPISADPDYLRAGTEAQWLATDLVLRAGEDGAVLDAGGRVIKQFFGDGINTYASGLLRTASDAGFAEGAGSDICLLAGQSNEVGRGPGIDLVYLDPPNPRIKQYAGSGPYFGRVIPAMDPLFHHEIPVDTIGHAMTFARHLIDLMPANRTLLLVPTARGNTGFSNSGAAYTWTPGVHVEPMVNLFDFSVAQGLAALATPGVNKVKAILWHQGEANAATAPSTYRANMLALIDGYRAVFGADVLFILGQMAPENIADTAGLVAINQVHIDLAKDRPGIGFWYGSAGHVLSDRVHYDAVGQRLGGDAAFYDGYRLALANVIGTAPVAPAAPVLTQSGTTITATITRPTGRFTDFTWRYRVIGSPTWTTWAHTATPDRAATITGLALGSSYEVQTATVNEQGTSAFSASATITLANLPAQVTGLTAGTPTSATQPLTWAAAAGALAYLVEYKAAASGTWLTWATVATPATTITGLTFLTSYDYRVTATNLAGAGPSSATLTASTLDRVNYFADTFDRADSPTLGLTSAEAKAWLAESNTGTDLPAGIVSNQAKRGTGGTASRTSYLVDSYQHDGALRATVGVLGDQTATLIIAYDDIGNYVSLSCRQSSSIFTYTLQQRTTAGGVANLASSASVVSAAGDAIKVTIAGNQVTVEINGVVRFGGAKTMTVGLTGTRQGFLAQASSSGAETWDAISMAAA